jgi:hypothetical protein
MKNKEQIQHHLKQLESEINTAPIITDVLTRVAILSWVLED